MTTDVPSFWLGVMTAASLLLVVGLFDVVVRGAGPSTPLMVSILLTISGAGFWLRPKLMGSSKR